MVSSPLTAYRGTTGRAIWYLLPPAYRARISTVRGVKTDKLAICKTFDGPYTRSQDGDAAEHTAGFREQVPTTRTQKSPVGHLWQGIENGTRSKFRQSRNSIVKRVRASARTGAIEEGNPMLQFAEALYGLYAVEDGSEGQGLVEYGLIIAFIAVVVIVAMVFLRTQIGSLFSKVGNSLS